MCAGFYGGGVVRQDHNPPGGVFFNRLVNGAYYVLINLLDCLFLGFGIARVARLIGGLDMDDDDIVILQRLNRGCSFTLEIGIVKPVAPGTSMRSKSMSFASPLKRSTAVMPAPLRPNRFSKLSSLAFLP